MRISEDVRKYALDNGYSLDQAIEKGNERKSEEFTSQESELYS